MQIIIKMKSQKIYFHSPPVLLPQDWKTENRETITFKDGYLEVTAYKNEPSSTGAASTEISLGDDKSIKYPKNYQIVLS